MITLFISWLVFAALFITALIISARKKQRAGDQYSEEEHKYFRGDDDVLW